MLSGHNIMNLKSLPNTEAFNLSFGVLMIFVSMFLATVVALFIEKHFYIVLAAVYLPIIFWKTMGRWLDLS